VLASARWREILANLPGYKPSEAPGSLLAVDDALPWWRPRNRRNPANSRA
jgi:hypothetical protein